MRAWLAAAAALIIWNVASPAQAQPRLNIGSGNVRFVVPGPPGGPAGATVQLLANKVSAILGVTIVPDYRPGAGGNIALQATMQSKPDGGTILFIAPYLVTNPYFQKVSVPPDSVAPVVQFNRGVFILLVHPGNPAKTVQELVARVRAAPGKVSCAATTVALSLVSCHVFAQHAGEMLMVGFQGNAAAGAALARGEIDVLFDFINVAQAPVREGRLRALAATARAPKGMFENLPATESVAPGFELTGWQGLAVSKETPRAIVMALNAAFNKALQDPDVRKIFEGFGLEIVGGTPEDFAEQIARANTFYAGVAKAAKIVPQ
ncbi:MAG: tripartite tricarboxylate transporter substrate binding protein [Alphaproteobacteria bacterium]|nr:tripartite tricarboxylate transporter substrate binding protein [Alphaproteobacteria bacterium]